MGPASLLESKRAGARVPDRVKRGALPVESNETPHSRALMERKKAIVFPLSQNAEP